MIYLGEQIHALNFYKKTAVCWLGVKILGRKTISNTSGFMCSDTSCIICNGNSRKRSNLDSDFVNLFNTSLIEELITAKPNRLLQIEEILKVNYLAIPGKTLVQFKRNAKKLFVNSGYTDWFLEQRMNYKLAQKIDIHTCSYCNREYIFVYEKRNGRGMVPQFDHWFNKLDYPVLALSFYNLIPSCNTCNTIKSTVAMSLSRHLHPYIDTILPTSYRFSYVHESVSKLKLVLRNNSINNKPSQTFSALEIPAIYSGHSNKELRDLYNLRYKYSDNYLYILLSKTFGELSISETEKYRLIFGIELDEKNYHKRIMSKFKKDIISELLSIN